MVENPIVFGYSKKHRAVENNGSMRFIPSSGRKVDEFGVLEHKSTGRKKKIEGIEIVEDSVLDISRGAHLDRTSEL